MASCKYCDEEIEWEETDEGWRPFDLDTGERHRCSAFLESRRSERKGGAAEKKRQYSEELVNLRTQVADMQKEISRLSAAVTFYRTQAEAAGAARRAVGEPLDQLFLLPEAPPELVAAAFRVLAQIHHPDKGGSNETMRRVNAAYEKRRGR